jgi:CARDB
MARGVAVSVASLALSVSVGGTLASLPRPDLVVTRVAFATSGSELHVTAVVANRGGVAAPRSVVSYALGGTRIGSRSVRTLRPGSSIRIPTTLAVSLSIPAGAYHLRVCADDTRRIREGNERNNCLTEPRAVALGDRRSPKFAGLERATTCIPGPATEPPISSRYGLQWQAASDDTTPATKLAYDIYQSTTPGAENLNKATYTSEPGAMSFTTPPLPADAAYYFIVRARDEAGNRDANRVERVGMNLCV